MDLISDSFSRIQVALKARKRSVIVLNSKFIVNILRFLVKQGLILGFLIKDVKHIEVYFKYINNKPYFFHIARISKCSKRIYVSYLDLKFNRKYRNLNFGVLNTSSHGLITVTEALLVHKIGGELLFKINF